MEYFAFLIPLIIVFILYKFYRCKMAMWEYLIPFVAIGIFIVIFKWTVKTVLITDTEYHGSIIVEARYYEYWESYVHRICTRQVPCGTDKDGKTQYCTETYDCSYCDQNSAYWKAYDNLGNSYSISENKYKELTKQWSTSPQFVELNRSITKYGFCGKDGDMYSIKWNGKPETSDAAVRAKDYENKIQASHSAFKLPYISKEEAEKKNLYNYPRFNGYKQQVVLGLDSLYTTDKVQYIEKLYQYFNGVHGPKNRMKLFVCLFYDKPIKIAFDQEAYWDGGNQNELVVCIGLNRQTKQLDWVKAFSWTDHKRILVDCREDIMEMKTFDPLKILSQLETIVENNDLHRSFKTEFSYITVDLPNWALITIYIVALVFSIGIGFWCVLNDFENE